MKRFWRLFLIALAILYSVVAFSWWQQYEHRPSPAEYKQEHGIE